MGYSDYLSIRQKRSVTCQPSPFLLSYLILISNRVHHQKEDLLIYFWLHCVFMAACRLSLVLATRGYSQVAIHGLLIAVASLAVEHGLNCPPHMNS